MSERIELETKDNVRIVGDYYPALTASAKGLLLLHMMPATRASWKTFAEKAQSAGFNVLAVDLRGHGESQGGPEGYKNFSDAEHQASRYDAAAGVEFLNSRSPGGIYLGGASIGANLALQYLAEHPETKAAFLLSPGLDYRGIRTEESAQQLGGGQAVYYAASRDDPASAEAVQILFDKTPAAARRSSKLFDAAGHGTTIFTSENGFMDEIISWLEAI